MSGTDQQWFYNPTTGEVTQGKKNSWADRMGPYSSREEAENAIRLARQRNEAADHEEDDEDNWGKPASWE